MDGKFLIEVDARQEGLVRGAMALRIAWGKVVPSAAVR